MKGKRLEEALREYALGYPEATEEFPWGERALKVRGKIFAFVGSVDGDVRLTLKLPASGAAALAVQGAARAGYGLGKAGWVSLRLATDGLPPLAVLREWVDESYRAVAPKRLVKTLPAP